MPTSLDRALNFLRCPVCGEAFSALDRAVACPSGHSFDIAHQGYVSLLVGNASAATADTAAMVAARQRFLERGHYDAIADTIGEVVPDSGLCIDLGGGTGYYLARLLDTHSGLYGIDLDLSKHALRRAARAHPRLAAVAADAWKPLPIADSVASCVLSTFSPRNAPEIRRMLTPSGLLVVTTPTPRHLAELVGTLGLVTVDDRKEERLDAQLHDFERVSSTPVEYPIELSHDEVLDAILMGPSARHVDAAELADRVVELDAPVHVTVSVNVTVYRGASPPLQQDELAPMSL
jgi:23S rRNA (guanine745-N1)-methyltransferase